MTFSVPARSCSPSTFCVTTVKPGKRRLHAASTSWARLGRQRATSCRRQSYHSQTVLGSCANASGVASSSGRKSFQRPPGPRKVGTPLAAETPAPVRTVMRAPVESRRARDRRSASSVMVLLREVVSLGCVVRPLDARPCLANPVLLLLDEWHEEDLAERHVLLAPVGRHADLHGVLRNPEKDGAVQVVPG